LAATSCARRGGKWRSGAAAQCSAKARTRGEAACQGPASGVWRVWEVMEGYSEEQTNDQKKKKKKSYFVVCC
jgi:hypothetical protein